MENTKHILFISSWYPNRTNPTHGIFNRYFAEAVAQYHQVSVLHVCSDQAMSGGTEVVITEEKNLNTLTCYYKKLGPYRLFGKFRKVLNAYEAGYQRISKQWGTPDVIHLNVIMPAGIGMYRLSRKHKLPYVVNENWSGYTTEDGSYRGFFTKFFTRRVVRGASAIMPTSKYLENAMRAHRLHGHYAVVPNPVNTTTFKPGPVRPSGETTLIHISSLNDREKNVSGIIRSFALAAKHNETLFLHIVGEGIDKPLYESLVDSLGLSHRVRFKGRLMATELVKAIHASDGLIMFSNYETFCLVILEVFACGKPVITSNAGAIPEYMNDRLGIMVERGSEQQLEAAITRLAAEKQTFNAQYIRDFAVNHCSYELVGKKLSAVYDLALNAKTR